MMGGAPVCDFRRQRPSCRDGGPFPRPPGFKGVSTCDTAGVPPPSRQSDSHRAKATAQREQRRKSAVHPCRRTADDLAVEVLLAYSNSAQDELRRLRASLPCV
jgi:hypothetical protein